MVEDYLVVSSVQFVRLISILFIVIIFPQFPCDNKIQKRKMNTKVRKSIGMSVKWNWSIIEYRNSFQVDKISVHSDVDECASFAGQQRNLILVKKNNNNGYIEKGLDFQFVVEFLFFFHFLFVNFILLWVRKNWKKEQKSGVSSTFWVHTVLLLRSGERRVDDDEREWKSEKSQATFS